jgi:hypothetical protein
MRISSFGVLAVLAAGLAFADSSPQTATYIDGNVAGVAPKTGGTLLFAGDQTMNFRTGLATVPVPYANISHAELGAVVETSKSHPFYKVWEIRKHKPQNQYLIVNFANEEGEQKTMTLELEQSAAPDVLGIIQSHNAKAVDASKTQVAASSSSKTPKPDIMRSGPAVSNSWWGDDVWKTTRNADKWNAPSSASQQNQR